MAKVDLRNPNVLRNISTPVLAHVRYINGPGSQHPGEQSKRLLLVTNTTDTLIEGNDFSRDGEFRRFRRDHIIGAEILGALLPVVGV